MTEVITMNCVRLEKHLANFVRWFSNLRLLQMRGMVIDPVSFPHVEHLNIEVCNNDDAQREVFTFKNLVSLLHANRKLRKLTILASVVPTLGEVLNAINENKSISYLHVFTRFRDGSSVNMIDLKRLVNEHPLIEVLHFGKYRFTVDAVVMLTQQLNSLKQFIFRVIDRTEYDRLFNELNGKWQIDEMLTVEPGFKVSLNR